MPATGTTPCTVYPSFGKDPATALYYDQRAGEYDEWYEDTGQYAARNRAGWPAEVVALVELARSLPPRRTIDIACGTGFLTRHLQGFVVGLDQSPAMAAIAQARLANGLVLIGDALHLQVTDKAFDRVFTATSTVTSRRRNAPSS